MIKTVTLTANSELAVDIAGSHCKVKNRGSSTVYASRLSGISAGADEVIAVDSGTADVLRNVGQYGVKNGTYGCTGKLYLLSDTDCMVEIQTADDLHFFKSGGSGGGEPYDDTAVKADISALQTGKADKTSVYTKSETDAKIAAKSGETCIVCSLTQPANLQKGLWIESDISDKDINIVDDCDDLFEDESITCIKSKTALSSGMSGTSAAAVDSVCYIFGESKIQIYDTETNIRTISSITPTDTMNYASAAAVGSKCYIFGGNNNEIQIYDTETNTMTTSTAALSDSIVSRTSAAAIGSKCYIFGGAKSVFPSSKIQIYDTETNTITTSSTSLSKAASETSAVAIGSKCCIFGGNNNEIQIYDTETNTITTSSSVLSNDMSGTSAAAIGSKCYIFGGYHSEGDTETHYNYIQIYDTKTNTITTSTVTLAKNMSRTSAAAIGSKCYVFGGKDNSESFNFIQICSYISAHVKNSYFSDSVLIIVNNDSNKQIANKTALSVQGRVYSYKPVKNIYYVDSDDVISELTYHKIENNQAV